MEEDSILKCNQVLIPNIRSTKHGTDPGVIHRLRRELEVVLKRMNIPADDFRFNMQDDSRSVIVYGRLDRHTIERALDNLSQKREWAWDELEYFSESLGLPDEDVSEVYQELHEIKGERNYFESEVSELKKQVSPLEGKVKLLEDELETANEQIEQLNLNKNRLEEKNKEYRGELGELRARFSELGEIPSSVVDYNVRLVQDNINLIHALFDGDLQFYIRRRVFNKLDDLLEMHQFDSEEQYLEHVFRKLGITVLEGQTASDFLENMRLGWEETPEYKEMSSEYIRAERDLELLERYEKDDLPEAFSLLAPQRLDSLISEIKASKQENEEAIERFEELREEHNKRYECLGDVEDAQRSYELYEEIQCRAEAIQNSGGEVIYLIGYEAGEEPMMRIITPGTEKDKYLGKLIREPLQEIKAKYGGDLEYSKSMTELICPMDTDISTREAISLSEKKICSAKEPIELFGFSVSILKIHKY